MVYTSIKKILARERLVNSNCNCIEMYGEMPSICRVIGDHCEILDSPAPGPLAVAIGLQAAALGP